jgi:glycosyltransferase involved in cell wall biosynthesis
MKEIEALRKTKYELIRTINSIQKTLDEKTGGKPRILFVAPHLSTGGMPQYLYKKIEIFNDLAEVYCVQYNNTSEAYVVQRNRIKEKIGGRFYCLDIDKSELLRIIDDICPDVIHFDDFVEFFIDDNLIRKIYSEDRPYFIVETCHSSNISPTDKVYCPDKFVMVNKWMSDKFSVLSVPVDILEYPIEKHNRPDRDESLRSIGLDPNKKHVINVGLFTPGKNQGELIEYARTLEQENIEFHFIGNTAPNFQNYWEPLLANLPTNCRIWGERNDTDSFYKCADLFVFTSNWELNPIVIKESLSWQLPILMRRLEPYGDSYDNDPLVHYLSPNGMFEDQARNVSLIKRLLDLP